MWCLWFSALVFLHLMVQLCKDRFEYVSMGSEHFNFNSSWLLLLLWRHLIICFKYFLYIYLIAAMQLNSRCQLDNYLTKKQNLNCKRFLWKLLFHFFYLVLDIWSSSTSELRVVKRLHVFDWLMFTKKEQSVRKMYFLKLKLFSLRSQNLYLE